MSQAWIVAGLPPGRFWDLTLRQVALEFEAAQMRIERERELVWFGAMLPLMKQVIPLDVFIGRQDRNADRVERFHAAWDRVDRALRG